MYQIGPRIRFVTGRFCLLFCFVGKKYICHRSYVADSADEISLDKGCIVEVLESNLDGWWLIKYVTLLTHVHQQSEFPAHLQFPVDFRPNSIVLFDRSEI